MNKIKQWFYMIRLVFVEHLAYIEAQWFDIVGTIVSVFLYYAIWQIIFKKYDSISGYMLNQMTSYIILSRVLSSQFSDGINETLAQWIYSGQIGTELTRPVSIFTILWTRRIGEFIFFAVFKAMPTLFIAFFVLGGTLPFNITYVIPFAFVSYYPTLYLIGKGTVFIPICTVFIAILLPLIAIGIWNCGMKKYDSTGT